MKSFSYCCRVGVLTGVFIALLLTGCANGEQTTDVTGRMSSSAPSTLHLQVAQAVDHDFTIAAGGVGTARLDSGASPSEQGAAGAGSDAKKGQEGRLKPPDSGDRPTVADLSPGKHVVIVNNSDKSRVAVGRLKDGVATYPNLKDGNYTTALIDIDSDGWVSGIGVVDVTISDGVMTSAVPEIHTRTLPVVVEQDSPGELSLNASPTTHDLPLEITWRMVGPDGETTQESGSGRTTVGLGSDGDYTLEVQAVLTDAPDVPMQSVRYTFTVTNGQVTP